MKPSASIVEVKAFRLSHGLGLPLPQYQTEEAAGMDLIAAVPLTTPLRLLPGMRQLVPTGLTIEIPRGFEGQVRPRSGLALNHGVTVLNAPGTIDSDYRGELKVLLVNLGRETFVITRGQRIAQLVISAVSRAEIVDVRAVAASRRGDAGFGSTGLGGVNVSDTAKPAPAAAAVPAKPAVAVKPAPKPAPAAAAAVAAPMAARSAAPAVKAGKPAAAPPPSAQTKAAASAKALPHKATPAKPAAGAPAKAPAAKVNAAKKPMTKPQPVSKKAPLPAGKAKATVRA